MADPQHVEDLDAFDRRTVILYRAGLVVGALGLLAAAALLVGAPEQVGWGWLVIYAGAALSLANLHLYDKGIRWGLVGAGWLGGALLLAAAQLDGALAHWVQHAGLGFVFVALSGFAWKEQFCFRIPFMRLMPVFLAGSLIPLLADRAEVAALLLGAAALLQGILAGAKLRMPLHYDIGDKAKYQV